MAQLDGDPVALGQGRQTPAPVGRGLAGQRYSGRSAGSVGSAMASMDTSVGAARRARARLRQRLSVMRASQARSRSSPIRSAS